MAAVELLEFLTQAQFNQMVVRLELEDTVSAGTALSVAAKCALLGRIVVQQAENVVQTLDGAATLGEAVVREAVKILDIDRIDAKHEALRRGLARDGFVVTRSLRDGISTLRAALPNDVQLADADDEVHKLLKDHKFMVPLGHLDQAIEAHTRGDWAACNSQIRTFLEGLLDCIAYEINAEEASRRPSSENRRALLAEIGFLSVARNEWTTDGKNFINGAFKMLHTDGSHPGLSDEDHSTFRLQLVLVTARMFLRRLHFQH